MAFVYIFNIFLVCISLVEGSDFLRHKRQIVQCSFRGRLYLPNQRWTFDVGLKTFECVCATSGVPNCSWQSNREAVQSRCYDRSTRQHRDEGEEWERIMRGRTLDCTCEMNQRRRMQIACNGENRCHYDGVSYRTGDDWQANDGAGLVLDCLCNGAERVTCKASVTTEVPRPAVDAQWIEDHIVYGRQILRPRITTLQACDTGQRVVSSGYSWNQTSEIRDNDFTVERCECRDALIQCEPYHVTRSREPHCVTVDGQIKWVGEQWTRVHHSHANIRWRCDCRAHGQKECRDIGYCEDPSPPPNGAMVCVVAGDAGPEQSEYCKPLCAEGYDFINRQRYYRIWEVCSQVTHHRWSGGYADDALLLAKCHRPGNAIRGRRSLYLPTNDCESLTNRQIHQIKLSFIRSLHRNHLCRGKCQAKWFRCGPRQ